jgi:glycosyltransferase involved in cell wall biosynthesis
VEIVVHEIASGLMAAYGDRVEVHVIYSTRYADERLDNPPYRLHILDVSRLRFLPSKLRATVAAQNIDVLISAQVEPSVLAWLVTRGLRVSIFLTHLHGNPQIEERQGSRRTRIAFALFRRLISPRTSAVLAVSPSLQAYAAIHVSPLTPVYFVKNPGREIGGAETRLPPSGVFRLVNLARLSHQKGLDILLRALALARRDLPPTAVSLVGSGPDEAELKDLCRQLGLDDMVTFAGYTSEPDQYLRWADCFVLPSRWEGFPLVLLEALRFGLPLLAADCPFGPADLITDSRIGELVPPEDPRALARGLVRAARRIDDPMAEDFRRTTARAYDRAAAAQMHFGVLARIVAAHARRTPRLDAFKRATEAVARQGVERPRQDAGSVTNRSYRSAPL